MFELSFRPRALFFCAGLSTFVPLAGCGGSEAPGSSATLEELIARYEAEGAIEFLTPRDRQTQQPIAGPTRDAFRLVSPEAEVRFEQERSIAIATVGQGLSGTDWFCYGESSHTIDGGGLVSWSFYTRNDSTRKKREANVWGTVFHPNGLTLSCTQDASASANTCTIYTTLASGYNSAVGEHEACEKRSLSYVCTNIFATSDSL